MKFIISAVSTILDDMIHKIVTLFDLKSEIFFRPPLLNLNLNVFYENLY